MSDYFEVQFDDMPPLRAQSIEYSEVYFVPENPFRPDDPYGTLPPEPFVKRTDARIKLARGTVIASTEPGEATPLPVVGRYEPYHVQLLVQHELAHEIDAVVVGMEQDQNGFTITVSDETRRI